MTKKLFSLVALSLAMTVVWAQETNYSVVNVADDGDDYKVETNRFGSNWFVGVGAGAQLFSGGGQATFGQRLTPDYNIHLGKWFTPSIGVRVKVDGFQLQGMTKGDYARAFNSNFIHPQGDALFNFSNLFGGYKEKRIWSVIPYAGLGWIWTKNVEEGGIIGTGVISGANRRSREITGNFGILNSIHLVEGLDLTADLSYAAFRSCFTKSDRKDKSPEGVASLSVGLAYRFPNRGWQKGQIYTVVDQTSINQLEKAIAGLTKENNDLRILLENCQTPQEFVKKIGVAAPLLITFVINRTDLSNKDRVNLGFFADIIKAGDPDMVYTITGFADKGTGNPTLNENLSIGRAKAVYDCLVNEFGVDPARLIVDHKGGVDNMFYDEPRLSRAVIARGEIKKD